MLTETRTFNTVAADTKEIRIYDVIGKDFFGGISAADFADELQSFEGAKTIHVRLNSPGGDVSDGMAIHQLLTESSAEIIVSVDGMAASIASVIAMAGDTIQIAPSAMMMIHSPWVSMAGDADALRQQAAILDKVAGQIADIYASKTGLSKSKVADLMAAETWMTGQECIDAGFADRLTTTQAVAACA